MRLVFALGVTLVVAACGSTTGGSLGAPSRSVAPASASPLSGYAAAVQPLGAALDVTLLLPAALRPGLTLEAQLVAAANPRKGGSPLGDPVLFLSFSDLPDGKPVLSIVEGGASCCVDFSQVTPAPLTIATDRGQLSATIQRPAGASVGPTLRWREPGGTAVVLTGSPFGDYADEASLIELARTMRPVPPAQGTGSLVLYVSTHESHDPAGHRVYAAVRSGTVPSAARIVDASGAVVASAAFGAPSGCVASAAESVAALAVPQDLVRAFSVPSRRGGYRIEVELAGAWTRTLLVMAGCASIE